MENELLPCPFCGASARILFTNDGDMYGPDCDHKNGCLIHSIDFLEYATREDAIKDWNRRAVVNDSLTTCKDDLQNAYKRKEIIGDCTLILGDCLEVMPGLEAASVDMIWTDPPYGHGNNKNDLAAAIQEQRGYKVNDAIANDQPDTMRQVVDGMLKEAVRVLNPDCCCCCCCCCGGGGPRPTFAWLAQRMDAQGLSFFHSVIWDKVNPGLGWRYRRQHEMIMVAHRSGGKLLWADDAAAIGNVIAIPKMADGLAPDVHPNLKPLTLVRKFIQAHTAPGQIVLDPFMGSGTTGVACVKLGRKFIGIELEPKYFDIACSRIEEAYKQPDLFIEPQRKAVQEELI